MPTKIDLPKYKPADVKPRKEMIKRYYEVLEYRKKKHPLLVERKDK